MEHTAEEIVAAFTAYVRGSATNRRDWFLDTSDTPWSRLFKEHGLKETDTHWMYRKAKSPADAQEAYKRLVKDLGVQAGDDGAASYVYLYRTRKNTSP